MAISFPISPSIGQIYTLPTGEAWEWNGSAWQTLGSPTLIQNGYELYELHDVLISGTPSDRQVLTYNGGADVWENKTVPQGGIQLKYDSSSVPPPMLVPGYFYVYNPFSTEEWGTLIIGNTYTLYCSVFDLFTNNLTTYFNNLTVGSQIRFISNEGYLLVGKITVKPVSIFTGFQMEFEVVSQSIEPPNDTQFGFTVDLVTPTEDIIAYALIFG